MDGFACPPRSQQGTCTGQAKRDFHRPQEKTELWVGLKGN